MRRRTARWLLAALGLVSVSQASTAEACSPVRPQAGLARPPWPVSSGLQLVSESIELDCDEPNVCRWRSVHVYARAVPGEPARVQAQLPFRGYSSLTIRWGGEPIEHEQDGGVWFWLEDDGQQLTIELEVEGEVIGEDVPFWRACRVSAPEIRHPFLYGRRYDGNTWHWLSFDAPAVASDAHTRVRVATDRSLQVEFGDRPRAARRPASIETPAEDSVHVTIVDHSRIMGGPFIALGGAILDANPARGRIGWEHAYPYSFLFYSAALETDFTREFTVVPALEITHGGQRIFQLFPRAGFGVGVPVQILPDPRPGLRTQVSFSWPVFSILTTFDWLPELPPIAGIERPHMFKLAFLGQFSF